MRFGTAGIVLGAALLSGCGGESAPVPGSTTAAPHAPAVKTWSVQSIDRRQTISATGTMAAKRSSNIGALTEGVIEKVYVRVGDRVKAGDPLFQTRPATYERLVREAEAAVKLADAQVLQAQRNFNRATDLASSNAGSKAKREDAETQLKIAEATRDQSVAALETAKQNLDDTTVKAPFDGVVTDRMVDEGVYLTNRFSMGAQSAVIQLMEANVVAAILRVPESALERLRLGLRGRLFISGSKEPLDSEIIILNDKVDFQSRTAEFRMAVLNADYRIKPGQFVRAEVDTDPITVLAMPRAALRGSPSERYVFVSVEGRAERRPVTVVDLDLETVAVVQGLAAGDVVIDGAAPGIVEGAPVTVEVSNVAG